MLNIVAQEFATNLDSLFIFHILALDLFIQVLCDSTIKYTNLSRPRKSVIVMDVGWF